MDEFCRRLGTLLPATVASAQCVEGVSKKEDSYAVREILRQLCSSESGEDASRILGRMAPAWLPALRREPAASVAGDAPPGLQRTRGELCGALEEMARDKVLILVFEDLQWANDSTLELISALARGRTPTKLMVLATCGSHCESIDHASRTMKQDLLIHRLGTEMILAPLPKTAVREMLSRKLGQETLPPGLDTFVYQNSEGNPLFVLALLDHLIAQRVLVCEGSEDDGRWQQHADFPDIEAGVPDEVVRLIEPEIARLKPEDQRILDAASLMRVVFPAWAVAAALQQDLAETEEACDQLARRLCFVHRAGHDELPDGTRSDFYAFAHGLYREVLYQKQPASRRARRHIRIAERLGELFAGREANVAREMATHFEAAGDWQRATIALRDAARHAQQRQAYTEAAQLLQHSLSIAENLNEAARRIVEQEIQAEMETCASRWRKLDGSTRCLKKLTDSGWELDNFIFEGR